MDTHVLTGMMARFAMLSRARILHFRTVPCSRHAVMGPSLTLGQAS